jgi:SAM-dependent methyltransferase
LSGMNKKYLSIVSHYENCLAQYGDNHLGVDWPKKEDAETRYRIMLELIKPCADREVSLLDFGCGASHLYEHMLKRNVRGIIYAGLDLSEKFTQLSKNKFPENKYYCLDILDPSCQLPSFDYVVMNGVFTEKRELSCDEMLAYFKQMLKATFDKTAIGLAFNVMSKQVDWEREDLFHLSLDTLANLLIKELNRNFVIRNDYGLHEYTTYVYK